MNKLLAALVVLALAPVAPLQAQDKGEGPTSLVIVYECKPEKRIAFRTYMSGPGVAQFEKWKKAGTFKDYLVLFSSYVNDAGWDMLVRLDFAAYADTEKWKAVERTMAGGLSPEALALCSPERSYLMDLTWEKAGPSRDLSKAVYTVGPYWWSKNHTQNKWLYKQYFGAKARKEYEAWVDAGTVAWYGAYINQHPYGDAWNMLVLVEYKDSGSLAKRPSVKQGVWDEKASDEGFLYARENADRAHTQGFVVLADPILPR
jgi:hypothetical protein